MKIIGINSKLSGPDKFVLNIQPSLTLEMFAEIRKIAVTPLLSSLSFENIDGCLAFRCPGGLTEQVSTNIEAMLKAATEKWGELQERKREQAEAQANLEQSMKSNVLRSASDLFKVPVQ